MRAILTMIVVLLTSASFSAMAGTVTVFECGTPMVTAVTGGTGCCDIINLSLPAECHIRKALMNVSTLGQEGRGPGCADCPCVSLNGTTLWQYNATDCGPFGRQDRFVNNVTEWTTELGPEGGTNSTNITLPKRGTILNATLDVNCSGASPKLANLINLTGNYPFGCFVTSIGDVNGDGVDDILVCNSSYGENGKVHLYFGGTSLRNTPDLNFSEGGIYDYYGDCEGNNAIGGAGDLNADGYQDIIIGAWLNSSGGASSGMAYVYFGGENMDNKADLVLWPSTADTELGYAVSGIGDINGDGYDDVMVLSYYHSNLLTYQPSINIYFGGPNMDNQTDLVLTEGNYQIVNPYLLTDAGDVNGDGFDDILLTDYSYNLDPGHGNNYNGIGLIYYSGPNMDNVSDVVITGSKSEELGMTASCAGDVNGDGYDDIILGAPYDANNNAKGTVELFLGGPSMDNVSDAEFVGEDDYDYFGSAVTNVGDLNNDGFGDIAIGTPYHSLGQYTYEGAVYIYYGSTNFDNVPDTVMYGEKGTFLGYVLSGLGDMNGDGFSGLLAVIEAKNSIEIFDGVIGIDSPRIEVGSGNIWSKQSYFNGSGPVADFADAVTNVMKGTLHMTNDGYGNSFADLEVRVSGSSDGNITLSNLSINYSYDITINDFTDTLNDYILAHKSDVAPGQNLSIPIVVHSKTPGALTLKDLYIMADTAPDLVEPLPDQAIDEDTAVSDLVDLHNYFKDDYDSADGLVYSIVSASNSTFVKVEIMGNQFLSVDALEGDANDNWTGTVEVVVQATDHWNSTRLSNQFTILVRNVNDPPVITSEPPLNATSGQEYRYQVTAVDGDNDTLTFGLSQNPAGMSIENRTGFVKWVPSRGGKYDIIVNANDGLETTTQEFIVSVPNRPPKVTNTTVPTAYLYEPFNYKIQATDEDGDSLTFKVLSQPEGLIFDETIGSLNWTPAQLGDFPFSVSISDGKDTTRLDLILKVIMGNRPPKFTTSPQTSAFVGLPYTYTAGASDMDNDPLTFQLAEMPAGMTVDGATGKVSWTPAAAGNFSVKITVSDGKGGTAVQQFSIAVKDRVRAKVEFTAPDEGGKVKGAVAITVKATDGTLGIVGVQLRLDSGGWMNMTGNSTWGYTLDTAKLKNGKHALQTRAFDGMEYSDVVNRMVNVQNAKEATKGFIPGFGLEIFGAVAIPLALTGLLRRKGQRIRT